MEALNTRKESANYLRISQPCFDQYVRLGFITPVRIGRRVLFRKESLDEFIDKCQAKVNTGKRN